MRWPAILLSLALAVPPVATLAVLAASGVAALTGGQPLIWPAQPVTLTEAIAIRDTAEILRQIALGADPNGHYDTWDVLKRFQTVRVTPLEAAVATREADIFDLIVEQGALLTPENARELHCFAVQEHASEIASSVAARFPASGSCDGVKLPW